MGHYADTKALIHESTDDALHSLILQAAATLDTPHRDFARWLADQPKPSIQSQLDRLKKITGYEWTDPQRRELFASGAFRTYFLAMREKTVRTARMRIEEVAVKAVEHLDWALDRAKANDDYRAVPGIATPAIERAMPRRQDLVATAPTIIIQISAAQKATMDVPAPILEAEVIEVLPVETGES